MNFNVLFLNYYFPSLVLSFSVSSLPFSLSLILPHDYTYIRSYIIKLYRFSQISHIFQLSFLPCRDLRIFYFNTEKMGISTDNEHIKFCLSSLFSLTTCCFLLMSDPAASLLSLILMTTLSRVLLRRR